MADVQSWWLKVERAKEHIKDFEAKELAYSALNPYETVTETDPDTGAHTFKVRLREPIPPQLALIAGDALVNLRAALDHVAVAVTGNERADFPCFTEWHGDKPKKFERAVKGASAKAIAVIRGLQPYHHCASQGTPISHHPLVVLSTLNNLDKHRRLMLVGNQATVTGIGIAIPQGRRSLYIKELRVGNTRVFSKGKTEAEVIKISSTEAEVKTAVTFQIAFDNDGAVKGQNVREVLQGLTNFVAAVLGKVEAFTK